MYIRRTIPFPATAFLWAPLGLDMTSGRSSRLAGPLCAVFLLAGLIGLGAPPPAGAQAEGESGAEEQSVEARYALERFAMVEVIAYLAARTSSETGIAQFDEHVLRAMTHRLLRLRGRSRQAR